MESQGTSLNWGRWLERLGIKRGEGLRLNPTAQPVVIVGDHRQLVSPVLLPAGVIGGVSTTAIGEQCAFTLTNSRPTWLHVRLGASTSNNVVILCDVAIGTRPALIGPVPLIPQPFELGASIVGEEGTIIRAAVVGEPTVRVASQSYLPITLFLPAGGWVAFIAEQANSTISFAATFWEMPNPNAP